MTAEQILIDIQLLREMDWEFLESLIDILELDAIDWAWLDSL